MYFIGQKEVMLIYYALKNVLKASSEVLKNGMKNIWTWLYSL